MPIFFLKHYHRMVPTEGKVWHLGREIAFEALSADDAIAIAREKHLYGLEAFHGLAILTDQSGNQVWEHGLNA